MTELIGHQKKLEATHFGELTIGNKALKCAVLSDETRVLTRTDFIKAIGRKGKAKGGRAYDEGFKVPVFLTASNLKPFIPNSLEGNSTPILFKYKDQEYIGYKAELLPEVCAVFLDAEEQKALLPSQIHIVKQCKILLKAFATIGITALIDEATGYQEIRDRRFLQQLLDRYIAKELSVWAKRFPDQFYQELFRLRGWQWKGMSINRPIFVGKLTNDLVYQRLAPGVLEELKKKNPKNEKGIRKNRYHQWLTEDVGHPALASHLSGVMALMRAASNWHQFYRSLMRAFPKFGDQQLMDLEADK